MSDTSRHPVGPGSNIYESGYVRQLFNRMSRSYERVNYITSFGFSLRWRRQVCAQLPASTDGSLRVLDIMTGMGEAWPALQTRFPHMQCTALDFSEGMLHYAEKRNQRRFAGGVRIVQADVFRNGLPASSYDAVLCCFGLKTLPSDRVAALAEEVSRLLAPGGTFACIEVSSPRPRLLRMLYLFYLKSVIPVLGRLFLGNPREYRMLGIYTEQFRNAHAAAKAFGDAGFSVSFADYFWGCASGFAATKGQHEPGRVNIS